MIQLYHDVYGVIILFILLICGLISVPLYINQYVNSLHIRGPSWDYEMITYGLSMYPVINDGDHIYVYAIDDPSSIEAAPGIGNIISFGRPDSEVSPPIVAHRAISKTTRNGQVYFQTKGDNNTAPDYWNDERGENYTWNGMISQRLLYGIVVGVRKTGEIQEPVLAMAAIIVSIIVVDFVGYKKFLEKDQDLEWKKIRAKPRYCVNRNAAETMN
jgi:signal peptidase I